MIPGYKVLQGKDAKLCKNNLENELSGNKVNGVKMKINILQINST